MADRPIIFSAPMVRALLDGRKTQTRRVLKPQPPDGLMPECMAISGEAQPVGAGYSRCDRLWVREACRAEELSRPPLRRTATKAEREKLGRTHITVLDELDGADGIRYLADDLWTKIENTPSASDRWIDLFNYRGRGENGIGHNVTPIHMPRWASRLTLIVTDVRVQRVQEITEADAVAEGIESDRYGAWRCYASEPKNQTHWADAVESYRTLWNSLHGQDAWDANPWVAAITFTVQQGNIDQMEAGHG